jgi:hypothetical protein
MFLNVKQNFYIDNVQLVQDHTDAWLSSYTSIFHLKHVTGYMHVFCHHLCAFVDEHGDFDVYNYQGIEKRNHQMTREYFSTNRRYNQTNYQYQMIVFKYRMENYKKNIPKPFMKRVWWLE